MSPDHSRDRLINSQTCQPMKLVAALTLLLSLVLAGCTVAPPQGELEPFDRRADYDYRLVDLPDAVVTSIPLSASGFQWPDLATDVDTALLEFSLTSAEGQDPGIAIDGSGIQLLQYFEQGGQGRRYLDLSPLLQAGISPGSAVRFTSHGAHWGTGDAALVAFSNSSMLGRRVLVLAPHPDDAEIAAFGVYQTANADVLTVTAGDAGGANFDALWPDSGEQYRAKGRIRTLDSLTVPFLGGLQPEAVRNLGYYDATLRQLWLQRPEPVAPPLAELADPAYFRRLNFAPELRDRPFESSWPSLVNDLLRELENVQPETIVAPHPMLDRHGDHQYAALALFEALDRWGGDSEILLYTNHAVGNEAYPLGPRDGMMGLPAWNGGPLHVTGLYSHQLSLEDRRRKLIALEAMHDLRPFDPRDGSQVDEVAPLFDYFRRGPRPNEIFLVTDSDGARAIYREYFAGRE